MFESRSKFGTYIARALLMGAAFTLPLCAQQDGKPSDSPASSPASSGTDPLKRPLGEKQKKENAKSLKQELSRTYKKWLNEDVVWIISDQERAAFKQLSNDEERDNFIEAFWQRRDPTPDTEENEFKEEHYRRIAYANEHYAAGIPGWKTDRGRIYIMYGPPDEIECAPFRRNISTSDGRRRRSDFDFPFEDLALSLSGRYRAGSHHRVCRHCMCGDYHMTLDRSKKDALKYTPTPV